MLLGREQAVSQEKEYVEVEAVCVSETVAAILVKVEGKQFWVPKSLLSEDSEVTEPGDNGVLAVEEWFALNVGIE